MTRLLSACVAALAFASVASASPPVASFIFPAGGQRGTTVPVRVGGLFLHQKCGFELVGKGVTATRELKRTDRLWFEGPLVPLPESQQSEDYPADMLGSVVIDANAGFGARHGRVWTSQGAAGGLRFVVGDLPEVVEQEIDGDPIAVPVTLPVTANGRIFPREDIDLWAFAAKKGESVTAFAVTTGINSPMAPLLEILDAQGHTLAEQSKHAGVGRDAMVRFTAPADGQYHVRVRDARNLGGPAFVYRLTITAGVVVDHAYPLGGRRGSNVALSRSGQNVPPTPLTVAISADAPATYSTGDLTLDVDDVPEFVTPGEPITPPAMLNGRVDSAGRVSEWRIAVRKGGKYEFQLRARKLGSPLIGVVTVVDAAGKELARAESADPATDPTLSFTAAADGPVTVRIQDRFHHRGGPEFGYRLKVHEAKEERPDFRLSCENELVNVPRAGTAKLKVRADRIGGFTGPIEMNVSGLLAGVTVAKGSIAAGQTTADLTFTGEPLAKIVAARVTVTGTAKLGTEMATRSVVFGELDHLLVTAAVPTPFKFTGEYTMSNSPRGQPYGRGYKLQRNGFAGPITVQLADRQIRHLQGVTAMPIEVPADKSEFDYSANLPAWIETGRTCRVTLMAIGTVKDPDGTEHVVSYTSTEQNHQMIVVPEPGRLSVETDATSLRVENGMAVRVPFRIARAKGLTGPVVVELVLPKHWRGVTAKPVTVTADQDGGELKLSFDAGTVGPFNMPARIRAAIGSVVAETKLELVDPK